VEEMMRIFLDTASIDEIKKWKKRIKIDGVTTNQKIFLAEKGVNFKQRVLEICNEIDGDVSIELTSKGTSKMVTEARDYASWHKNIVIKVPMTLDGTGLEVIKRLKTYGIKTNATCMMTAEQLILAAKAGATYVSIFYNRSLDSGQYPVEEIQQAKKFIKEAMLKCWIIAGSIRYPVDVGNIFGAGCDVATIPPKILEEILQNRMTDATIKEFDKAWQEFKK